MRERERERLTLDQPYTIMRLLYYTTIKFSITRIKITKYIEYRLELTRKK
jgi:hypothetical protein